MNKRHYYLASCLALLFSTASYAEVDCELQPVIEANLSLNQNQLASNGGYISSQLGIRNESCETVKFKYWLSIKGPEGIYFPAKAVVGVDTAQQESDALTDGRMLNVTRGFWLQSIWLMVNILFLFKSLQKMEKYLKPTKNL